MILTGRERVDHAPKERKEGESKYDASMITGGPPTREKGLDSRSTIDSLAATCSKTAVTFELADIHAAVDVSTDLESRLNTGGDDF